MIILGIDTNPAFSAIAILEIQKEYKEIIKDTFLLQKEKYATFENILNKYQPDLICIELFQWYSNKGINRFGIDSIIAIGYFQAWGDKYNIPIELITKPKINSCLGRIKTLKKSQMKQILEMRFQQSLKDINKHCVDAIAVALAGFYTYATNNYLEIKRKLYVEKT